MNLIRNIKITKVKATQSADTSDFNSDAVDMTNYEGCLFFTTVAAKNDGNYIEVEQSTTSAFTAGTLVTLKDSKVVPVTNGEVAYVEIHKPLESQGKYLRVAVTRGASTAIGDIYAVQYNSRVKPEVNEIATLMKGKLLISPGPEPAV